MPKPSPLRLLAGCSALVSLLSPGCTEIEVKDLPADLRADILYPEDAAEFSDGEMVTFTGRVSDLTGRREYHELSTRWTMAANAGTTEQTLCNEAPANPGSDTGATSVGESVCTAAVSLPFICLYAEGRAELGDTGDTDCITLSIVPPGAPSVAILTPTEDGVYYSDQIIPLSVTASDPEDAPEALSVQWTSLDGDLGEPNHPDSSGLSTAFATLTEGQHALTATVTDTDGLTGQAYVIVDVGPPNTAPSCAITSPTDGDAGDVGATVDFQATVGDVDVAEDWLSVTWSSDLDGTLRTSTPDSAGNVAFSYADLSAGSHVISLQVEDEVGGTCSDYVQYDVGSPPSVEIVAPIDGATSGLGASLRFEALVADEEDRPETLALDWESDLDGALSSSRADSTGVAIFTTTDLSLGVHSISLTATDSDGLYTLSVVTVTIEDCPDVWYADADADGYGDPASSQTGCSAPVGYGADASDCDDTRATVHPAATESCNGLDDDCDGEIDEGPPADATPWYLDVDGDAYGDASVSVWACTAPAGYVADDADCDDSAAGVSPGATEIPADDLDEDCDGAEACWDDADLDGYGSGTAAASDDLDCADAHESPVSTDCDDTRADTYPGATETAADGVDQDCDGGDVCQVDEDADGFGGPTTTAGADLDCLDPGESALAEDCDDSWSSVNPGAPELCDGVDNDCDGLADDEEDEEDVADPTAWYPDADGDGFGDPATWTLACAAPEGTVGEATDCDDADADAHPGATEVCNGVDDDCDGTIDDGMTYSTFYADADGDGHGAGTAVALCAGGLGWSATDTDCDDTNADLSPDATEICDDKDNDCDGLIDDDDFSADLTTGTTWYTDADADGYGSPSASSVACAAPAGTVANDGDCDDTTGAVSPAATELCDGVDDDCDGSIDDGVTTRAYQDADGDGSGECTIYTDECTIPTGHVASCADCDDGNASTYPGAAEACNGVDDDCDGAADNGLAFSTWYGDADADGYGASSTSTYTCSQPSGYVGNDGDCDDASSAVSPSAAESCNGVDDNCSGSVDEGVTTRSYRDADGDGSGECSIYTDTCAVPAGYVASCADCNDGSASVYPGAAEACCNGVDDDCDGAVDDGVLTTYYRDADGDGYGTSSSSTSACSQPSGYVGNSSDCNDASSAVSPSVAESCNGVDDDCDGTADDGLSFYTWYRDADGDGYGTSATSTSACSQPSGYVSNNGDCNDATAAVSPADAETCNSVDDDCDGTVDDGVTTRYYRDADTDTHGNPSSYSDACSSPGSGWVTTGDDCDDSLWWYGPGMTMYEIVQVYSSSRNDHMITHLYPSGNTSTTEYASVTSSGLYANASPFEIGYTIRTFPSGISSSDSRIANEFREVDRAWSVGYADHIAYKNSVEAPNTDHVHGGAPAYTADSVDLGYVSQDDLGSYTRHWYRMWKSTWSNHRMTGPSDHSTLPSSGYADDGTVGWIFTSELTCP